MPRKKKKKPSLIWRALKFLLIGAVIVVGKLAAFTYRKCYEWAEKAKEKKRLENSKVYHQQPLFEPFVLINTVQGDYHVPKKNCFVILSSF